MGFLKALFGRRQTNDDSSTAAQNSIPPARFRKEDFAFDAFKDISSAEAQQKVEGNEVQILDVRFEYEFRTHHIAGATLIPLPQLPANFQQLDPSRPTLVVCEHGVRSIQACTFLSSKGFTALYNLVGGMSAYQGKQEKAV